MNAGLSVLLFIATSMLLAVPARAGTPMIDDTCRDRSGARVPAQIDVKQRYFALVGTAPVRGSSPRPGSGFVIFINPDRTYLGRQTQQWLYLRQCAHIVEGHQALKGQPGQNVRDEEAADCWAARELARTTGSPRVLYAIESDIERLIKESDRWREVLPGPQRRIALSSCSK